MVAAVSPRTRILALIGAAAVVVVAAVVLVAAGGDDGSDNGRSAARKGLPPIALDLGLRSDAEAKELRRAVTLYNGNQAAAAGRIFDRYSSPEAQVGSSFATWPDGTVASLEGLAGRYPRNSLVLLNLGLARFWSGDNRGASQAWLDAYEAQPDTASSLTADHLLNPNTPKGEPVFIPSFHVPALSRLDTAQLAELQRAARKPDVHARIVYGIALQLLGRERSAERAYASAVRAGAERSRAAGGGRRLPLHADAAGPRLLAPGPAHAALPEGADRALPPRPAAGISRADRSGRGAVPQGARDRPGRPPGTRSGALAGGVPARARG